MPMPAHLPALALVSETNKFLMRRGSVTLLAFVTDRGWQHGVRSQECDYGNPRAGRRRAVGLRWQDTEGTNADAASRFTPRREDKEEEGS